MQLCRLSSGQAEGYPDTFKQLLHRFYASISDPSLTPGYPHTAGGLGQLKTLEAELASGTCLGGRVSLASKLIS